MLTVVKKYKKKLWMVIFFMINLIKILSILSKTAPYLPKQNTALFYRLR